MNRASTVQLYRQLLGSSDDRQQSLWRHESSSSPNELAPFPVHNYLPVIEGALAALLTLGCRPPQASGKTTTALSSPSMGTDVALVVSFFKALCLPEAQWENVYGVKLEEDEMKVELVLCRGMRNLDWSEALRYRLSGKDQLQPDTLHMLAAAHIVPLHWRAIPLFDRLSYFTYLCEENSLDILSALLEFHELERLFAGLNYDDGTSELLLSAAEYLSDPNVFESLLNQTLWGDTVKRPTLSASSSNTREQEGEDQTYVNLDERDLNACVLAALSNRNANGAGAKIAQVLFQSQKLGRRTQIGEPGSVAARRWVEKAFHSGQASTVDFVLDDLKLWGGLDGPSTTKDGALTTLKMSEGNQVSSEGSATVHQRQRLLAKQVLDSIPSLASVVRWGTVQLLASILERACNVYARFRGQGPSPSELNRLGSDSSVDSEPSDKQQKTNCWSDWMTEKLSISHIALFRADGGEMVRYLASLGLLQPQRITSAWWDALIGECILGTVLKAGAVRAFAAMEGLMRPTVDMVAPLVLSCIVPHQVPAVVRNLQVLEEVLGLDLDGELSDISRLARPTVTYFAGMTLLDVLLAAPLYAFLDLFIFLNSRSKISIHQQRANGQSRFQVARWRGHEDIVAYCEKL